MGSQSVPTSVSYQVHTGPNTRRNVLSIVEMIVVYALIEAALWTEMPWRIRWSLAAMVVVIAVGIYRRDLWARLGLGKRDLRPAMLAVPIAFATAIVLLLCGWIAGTVHMLYSPHLWPVATFGYVLWALQQQYLVQSFFLTRYEDLIGPQRAGLAAAVTFASAHVPNPILMLATLVMALVFCWWFQRHRNIYPLAVAHAMLGLSLAASLPEPVLHRMRVGIGYLHYVAR